MKAWQLQGLGGELRLSDVRIPEPRPGSVLVRVEASALMSYLKAYVEGKLSIYNPPPGPFTIGTNGVGVVEVVGRDVWHLKPGQRVVLSSHFVAPENVEDPAQVLIGLTSSPDAAPVLADWPDGTLAEYALMPAEAVTRGRAGEVRCHPAGHHWPLHHPVWRPASRPARGRRDAGRQRCNRSLWHGGRIGCGCHGRGPRDRRRPQA
jgi:NADPH:quinone reductase-like Zn-dependent oxidoreductase